MFRVNMISNSVEAGTVHRLEPCALGGVHVSLFGIQASRFGVEGAGLRVQGYGPKI